MVNRQMTMFLYRVARADGAVLEGQAEGDNEQAVQAQLEQQGFLVFNLRRRGAWSQMRLGGFLGRRALPQQEFLVFNQEFLALVKAGLPILKAWSLLIERTQQHSFHDSLLAVRRDIRAGTALSDALARYPGHFPELYVASIRAGEQSGNLPAVLDRYINYLKLMIALRQKTIKALAYPAFLVLVGVSVIAFMLTYVLPTFSAIYGDTGTDLPPATQMLIALVRTIQSHFVLAMVALASLAGACRLWLRTEAGRAAWDRMLLRLPLVGELLRQHHTIQLTRTLATLLAGGIPVVQALQGVQEVVTNRHLAAGLARAVNRVREGTSLSQALEEGGLLPRLALEMIGVGEETGSLDPMLRDIAELYEGGLDQRLTQVMTWIEPALLLVMGVTVGAIVIIMYLPVFQISEAIK